jgi:hypothetical protein
MVVIGVALLVSTLARGVLFVAAGAARLYLARGDR